MKKCKNNIGSKGRKFLLKMRLQGLQKIEIGNFKYGWGIAGLGTKAQYSSILYEQT